MPVRSMRVLSVLTFSTFLLTASCSTSDLVELHPAWNELEQRVAGKENLPAEQVFDNIEVMKGVPAGRLLRIMKDGFVPALGVSCSYCHVDGNFASDEKEHKRIARDMWRMTGEINQSVKRIVDESAVVNCSTCHHGSTTPPVSVK